MQDWGLTNYQFLVGESVYRIIAIRTVGIAVAVTVTDIALAIPIAYYAAASTYYRIEWLFRNGKLPRGYAPTRYHLLAAVKTYLLGAGRLDPRPKKATEECRRILDMMWSPLRAEHLIHRLLDVVVIAAEQGTQSAPIGELVRTQRFADRVRKEVLALSGSQ